MISPVNGQSRLGVCVVLVCGLLFGLGCESDSSDSRGHTFINASTFIVTVYPDPKSPNRDNWQAFTLPEKGSEHTIILLLDSEAYYIYTPLDVYTEQSGRQVVFRDRNPS